MLVLAGYIAVCLGLLASSKRINKLPKWLRRSLFVVVAPLLASVMTLVGALAGLGMFFAMLQVKKDERCKFSNTIDYIVDSFDELVEKHGDYKAEKN